MNPPLRVIGPRWLADDLHAPGINVRHDLGIDYTPNSDDYWCSGAHYARLVASGHPRRFTTPGGMRPLTRIDCGRAVTVCRFDRLDTLGLAGNIAVFAKPNDVKLPDTFPAGAYTPARLRSIANEHPHLAGMPIVVSERISVLREIRFVITNTTRVRIATTYHDGADTWGRAAAHLPVPDAAFTNATRAITELATRTPLPPSWILDMAETPSGEWIPLETNPAASSGWFNDPPDANARIAIISAIRAGNTQPNDPFTWRDPIEFLRTRALPRSIRS